MIDLLLFAFATIGMTLILVRGSIFQPVRNTLARSVDRLRRRREKKGYPPSFSLVEFVHELIGCTQCMGFWCGLFCGFFLITSDTFWIWGGLSSLRYLFNRLLMLFCCGAAGSFLASLGDLTIDWLFFSKESAFRAVQADDERRAAEHHHDE